MKFGKFSLKSISKKGLAFGLSGGVALGLTGAALAYWTSTGTGTGTAQTGTTAIVTVNQTTVVTGMYPGEPAVTLEGDFTNTNPGSVKVGTVTGSLDTANLPGGCIAADFTVSGSAPVDAKIPTGTHVGAWTGVTIQMNDTTDNQDSCKGKAIPILYTVTAGS